MIPPKPAAALLAALLAAAPEAASAAPLNRPADIQAITAIEEDIATQTSMRALIHYFAPQAVILDFFAPGLYQGKAQIYRAFAAQLAGMTSMTHRILEINVESDGNFACDALEIRFDIALKNGRDMQLSLRQLDSFQKQAGAWRLVQQHISLPMDPKTGMMVMNGPLPERGPRDAPGIPPDPAATPARAQAETRQWLAANAKVQNAAQLAGFFAPGAILYDEDFPGELRGGQEIGAHYAPLLRNIAAARITMPLVAVASDGLLGAQIDTQNVALTLKDGSHRDIQLRQSDCLLRSDGEWRSIFEMVSYALDAQTGRAMVANAPAK